MTRAPRQDALAVGPPSAWVVRFAPLIDRSAGPVLDVACGRGRHLRWLLDRGHAAVGVDVDPRGVADLAAGPPAGPPRLVVRADLERPAAAGDPVPGWPFADGRFAGVIVTHYLWRPLFDRLVAALAPGGVLLYETFARGNERLGRPATPAHLLDPGELLDRTAGRLAVVAFEQGEVSLPRPAVIQRLAAVADDPAAVRPRPLPG